MLNNAVTAQYTHTLTVNGRQPGTYMCTVANNKPSSTFRSFTVQGLLDLFAYENSVFQLPMFVVGRDGIRVSWTPPSPLGDTSGYRIYYTRAGGSSDSVDVDGGNTNTHTLTGLSNGETYTISIVGTSTHFSSDTVPLPGRSGTFIAMLQKLEKRESLDIMNWVCRMRAQRASMVQTSVCLSLSLTHSLKALPVAVHVHIQDGGSCICYEY